MSKEATILDHFAAGKQDYSCPIACFNVGDDCKGRDYRGCKFYQKVLAEKDQRRGILKSKRKWTVRKSDWRLIK